MDFRRLLPLLLVVWFRGSATAADNGSPGSVTPQLQELQQKILGDEQNMALIMALQNDPGMQVLLSDSAVLDAVQAGDLGALMANPRFMKLLDNAKIKEIQKRVGE